jgi:hypothetical protein
MMKALRVLGLLAILASLPSANAADVSGNWKGVFNFQGTDVPLTFHLAASNGVVTGTVEGLPTTPAEIHDGKIDKDVVTFWVDTDYEGNTYKLVYRGTIAAGQIEFVFGTDEGSWSTTLTAKNEAETVAPYPTGDWKGTFAFQGTDIPLTFHLAAVNGTVTGTVEGLPTTPAEIHDGKIDGDTVTFWVNTDYEGNTYKLIYTGKISAEGIRFSFGTEDGQWGTELNATKAL